MKHRPNESRESRRVVGSAEAALIEDEWNARSDRQWLAVMLQQLDVSEATFAGVQATSAPFGGPDWDVRHAMIWLIHEELLPQAASSRRSAMLWGQLAGVLRRVGAETTEALSANLTFRLLAAQEDGYQQATVYATGKSPCASCSALHETRHIIDSLLGRCPLLKSVPEVANAHRFCGLIIHPDRETWIMPRMSVRERGAAD